MRELRCSGVFIFNLERRHFGVFSVSFEPISHLFLESVVLVVFKQVNVSWVWMLL